MVAKVAAAVAARRSAEFLIIARTDARAVEGLDGALERARRYREAGADVLFVEAPQSSVEIETIAGALADVPLLFNYAEGGKTPPVTYQFLRELGFSLVVFPISTLLAATAAMRSVLNEIRAKGSPIDVLPSMLRFEEFLEFIGISEIRELEQRFSTAAVRSTGRSRSDRRVREDSVSSDLAQRMIAGAQAKAEQLGVPMVIAVCDESGVLKAFSRMDGAALLSVQIAQDKAYTAIGFGMSTDGWHDFIKDDPPLASGAVGGIDRLVIFGGGYPIKVDDRIVGGIGVSGGHTRRIWRLPRLASVSSAEADPRKLSPRKTAPVRRSTMLWPLERRVGLPRIGRRHVHARAVARGELGHRIEHLLVLRPRAGHQDRARPLPGADEDVFGTGRTVDEVPLPQQSFRTLNQQPAFAGEHEERLLLRLGVVETIGLTRLHHGDVDAELGKLGLLALELASRSERLRDQPVGVAHVDDEPALSGGCQAGT